MALLLRRGGGERARGKFERRFYSLDNRTIKHGIQANRQVDTRKNCSYTNQHALYKPSKQRQKFQTDCLFRKIIRCLVLGIIICVNFKALEIKKTYGIVVEYP
jgi:hypothetical protein